MRTTLARTFRFPAASLCTTSFPSNDSAPDTWACAGAPVAPTIASVRRAVHVPLVMRFIGHPGSRPPSTVRLSGSAGHSPLLVGRLRPAVLVRGEVVDHPAEVVAEGEVIVLSIDASPSRDQT